MKQFHAAIVFTFSGPALACTSIPEETSFRNADYVVEGVMACPADGEICELRVSEHLKDFSISRIGQPKRFLISEKSEARRQSLEEGLILSCAMNFTPRLSGRFGEQAFEFFGRFYLYRRSGSSAYRVKEFLVRGDDRAFYWFGLSCSPESVNESLEGSCERVYPTPPEN